MGTSTSFQELCNEVMVLKSVSHINVVLYYGEISMPGIYGFAMEYCPEGDLHDRIVNEGTLSEREIKVFLKQMLETLAYIHARQIVHRDIKTKNILISNGSYKLCDFGNSVLLDVKLPFSRVITLRKPLVTLSSTTAGTADRVSL